MIQLSTDYNQAVINNFIGIMQTLTYVLPALPVSRPRDVTPAITRSKPTTVRRAPTRTHGTILAVAAPARPTEEVAAVAAEGPSIPIEFAVDNGVGGEDTGLPLSWDDTAIETYWNARPSAALARLAEVTTAFIPLILRVAIDAQRGVLQRNTRQRAAELRAVLSRLGPTFVKLGQALSVRPDIIGPEAMGELRALCDAVPSFSNKIAFQMMEEQLGRPVVEMYDEISERPIAAASLGQVYKARLRATGEYVAVKVQRPDMLRKVSLDLYCMKRVAKFATKIQETFTAAQTDYVSLLLQWAKGTYKELDYENEAANSRKFAHLIHKRLPDVYVPKVYDEYTSRKVLTMEWIEGTKLADCKPEEINALVSKGVECFLYQLLSAGFFHADPHQGNLMRLANGQLCVIDFGLMAVIEKQEMDAMVSAIVHLANRDWPRVVEDFINLKFLPRDVDTSKVTPVLGAILDQALEGGGAKSINFQTLSDELASVTFDFPFSIPPAFALLLRALSVLEGIALVGDPEFKLIMESFPFVSKLVMSDRSPALGEALRQILYKEGTFSPTRLRVLVDSSQGIINEGEAFVDFDTPSKNSRVTKDAIDFLFSAEGAVVKDILVEEIAKGIDVFIRNTYYRTTTSFGRLLPSPLRSMYKSPMAAMSPLPFLFGANPFFALPPVSDDEMVYLENIRQLVNWIVSDGLGDSGASPEVMVRLMPEILQKSQILGSQVLGELSEKVVARFFNDFLRGGGEEIGGRRRVTLLGR